MTAPRHAALRQIAQTVLARRRGPAPGADAVAAAARDAYDDLAEVTTPLIGQSGIDVLVDRALYLAQQEYSWLGDPGDVDPAIEPFVHVMTRLARQDPAVAAEGAAGLFAVLAGLLVTFIGEPLTTGLMRKAWPEAFSGAQTEEN